MKASDHIATELKALADLPDAKIDTSDIPERLDWSYAVRGRFGPFISALHEAAHVILKCVLTLESDELRAEVPLFRRMVLRTAREVSDGPYNDHKGHDYHCSAITDGIPSFDQDPQRVPRPWPDFEFVAETRRRNIKKDIIVSFAGGLAEAKQRRCAFETLIAAGGPASADWHNVESLVDRLNLDVDTSAKIREDLIKQTSSHLAKPVVWSAINRLATSLVKRKNRRMTWKQALPIIRRSLRRTTG